ncbi:hypothetical protein Bca52824_044260 [Brassica carinata]|uniref:Glycosyltransferase n=1 Tax=Brassica carinata TaxID=52824 RepID=A0A8X7V2U7_BRACI|nr:hypothetical protein Bca52824_044260 [Brassica carinata]
MEKQRLFSSASPLSYSSNSILCCNSLLLLITLLVILGVFLPWAGSPLFLFSNTNAPSSSFPPNGYPFFPFLNNWLISVSRQKHQDKVLVIAEGYATLYKVNSKWPGHAVLIPPALDSQTAHSFGSQGFFNLTSRRPEHLLQLLELGYKVMYNDVDMVWLQDPFPYLQGSHDVYFMDDKTAIKPLSHSHDLPPSARNGRTNICSCMIFLRPTNGAKLLMKQWIEELHAQPWSKSNKGNDQPGFNWALGKTAHQLSRQEECTSGTRHGLKRQKGNMSQSTTTTLSVTTIR